MENGTARSLQWASFIVPVVLTIIMAVMTFTNKTTTISATNLEKIVQIEDEQDRINERLEKLDEDKVDKEVFNMLKESIDKIDEKLDEMRKEMNDKN